MVAHALLAHVLDSKPPRHVASVQVVGYRKVPDAFADGTAEVDFSKEMVLVKVGTFNIVRVYETDDAVIVNYAVDM